MIWGGYAISTSSHIAAQVKREFTQRYKDAFGKGPEDTSVNVAGDVVIIKLKGFLTPIEMAMRKLSDGAEKIQGIRDAIYRSFMTEIGSLLKRITGRNIASVLKSLNLEEDEEYIFIIMEGVTKRAG